MSDETQGQAPAPQIIEHDPDGGSAQIIEEPTRPVTKGDLQRLGVDALDKRRVDQVKISATAGGVAFASALEVMEFAKLMAVADKAVPPHLRNQAGICLAITFQAVEWRMSPFAVANKSYVVNDRVAYESQLVHAVIEARAPLRERLDCSYAGEGETRTCTIIFKFLDGSTRTYTTPEFGKIRVKNSPLWKDDLDQQLFYYGSRSGSRKWCPDVLLGIYTRDEMSALPPSEGGQSGQGLRERLKGADRSEGHKPGHADSELTQIAADKGEIMPAGKGDPPIRPAAEQQPATGRKNERGPKAKPPTKAQVRAAADRAAASSQKNQKPAEPKNPVETDTPAPRQPAVPTNAAEYQVYCMEWIGKENDPEKALKRWEEERDMRKHLNVRTTVTNDLRFRLENKHGV